MNEQDRVVRHALETHGREGGEFHDTSGGYEIAEQPWLQRPPVGFTLPD